MKPHITLHTTRPINAAEFLDALHRFFEQLGREAEDTNSPLSDGARDVVEAEIVNTTLGPMDYGIKAEHEQVIHEDGPTVKPGDGGPWDPENGDFSTDLTLTASPRLMMSLYVKDDKSAKRVTNILTAIRDAGIDVDWDNWDVIKDED